MRNYFASVLTEIARNNSKVVLMYGDIGNKLFDEFKNQNKNRYFNCGVAEASMVGVAAGLAHKGFLPFVYTINSFLYLKALEQIKIDVCYSDLPVIFVGTGSGLSYSGLGTTHHSLEDIGILRTLPNLSIYAPHGPKELENCMKHALEIGKPSYIRIGKKESVNLPTIRVFSSNGVLHPYFSRESANIDTVVISTGVVTIQVEEALQRIDPMKNTFTHCVVPQLSPAPSQWITETLNSFGRIIVVEEHSSIGGLYSLVSELAHYSDVPKEILGVNTRNTFHIGLGEPNEARDALGLSAKKLENYFDKLK